MILIMELRKAGLREAKWSLAERTPHENICSTKKCRSATAEQLRVLKSCPGTKNLVSKSKVRIPSGTVFQTLWADLYPLFHGASHSHPWPQPIFPASVLITSFLTLYNPA